MKEQDIQKTITEILKIMEIPAEVSTSLDADGVTWWANITIRDGFLFMARGGEGIVAFNHIVKEILRKLFPTPAFHIPVVIDFNGFQKKKIDNLKTIAYMMAERARFFKSSVSLDPMSPYDRRIIHEHLSEAKNIKTESEGEGRDRHVVIKYIETNQDSF